MGFSYLKSRYSPISARFSPVKQSNMNRFRNGFHSRIALIELWNIAAQSSSRHKLRRMKIIIKTFSGDNRFPCVSLVVFEAITISISLDLLARWTEQFGTSFFNRMCVWSCHLSNWCWFVGIRYFPSSIFVVKSSCTQSHGVSVWNLFVDADFDDSFGLFIFRTSLVWGRVRAHTIWTESIIFLSIIIFDLASLTAIRLSMAVVSPRSSWITWLSSWNRITWSRYSPLILAGVRCWVQPGRAGSCRVGPARAGSVAPGRVVGSACIV